MKTITMIGPLPEPKGGVSIHIVRLGKLVSDQFHVQFIDESSIIKDEYFNIRSKKLFRYLHILWNTDIVHIHSGTTLLRVIHLLVARLLFRKRVIVTMHTIVSFYGKEALINRTFLQLANTVIMVSEAIQEKAKLTNSVVKPAFIPPDVGTEPALPVEIENWLKQKRLAHLHIIAGNAYRIDIYRGIDLYGIDLCLGLIRTLVHEHNMPVAMIFIVSSLTKSEQKFREYTQQIQEWGLDDYVLLTSENASFVRIIELADMVVRPTCTDGDALTIREALFMGKPIIASDAAVRPDGTITFRSRDEKDFEEKVLATLYERPTTSVISDSLQDYAKFYSKIYND